LKKVVLIGHILLLLMIIPIMSAYAFLPGNKGDRTYDRDVWSCPACHRGGYNGVQNPDQDTIPHGNYTTTSDHCSACHQTHVTDSAKLLPKPTLSQTCNYCHDFTGSVYGVYRLNGAGVIPPKSGHRVIGVGYTEFNGTLDIPGGSDSEGGVATLVTRGDGELAQVALSCDSCHSPHGVNVVNRYIGESNRNYSSSTPVSDGWIFPSSRILRNKIYGPNQDTPTLVQNYGPAWCAACHMGRDNNNSGPFHNHPVDMDKYWGWGSQTVTLPKESNNLDDPRKNNIFVMREDLGAADGSVTFEVPMCQQCHASARDVTQKFSSANPEQQYRNFPHQSINASLLVEEKDNLCLNCHIPEKLP